ncbi:MAG TPA: hypothetical protein VNU92_16280 [Edaphobacter sp.]|jgi:hypothetical protein|nr:hypothetical protein [Edaphobacter sp.]
MRRNLTAVASLLLSATTLTPPAQAADKLKGFYSGSGGISADVHRVLLVEFAADGTAILQQKWHDKDPQTWHARWKQDGKTITLTYEDAKNAPSPAPPLPAPLIFTFKHGTLSPTSWDTPTLGVLGPPKLTAFDGKNPQNTSVAGCKGFNTLDPRRDCVTWSSNQ